MADLSAALKLLQELDRRKQTHRLEYYKPYDYQKNFHNALGYQTDAPSNQKFLLAGNQVGKCNSVRVKIDTNKGRKRLFDIFGGKCDVLTWPDKEPRKVTAWVRKPDEECFRITMQDGKWVEVPKGHLILTNAGFLKVEQLFGYLPESVFCLPPSSSVLFRLTHALGVVRLFGKLLDFLDDCSMDYHLDDAQLLSDVDNVQVFAPSQDDALRHNYLLSCVGGMVNKCKRSLLRFYDHLSSLYDDHQTLGQFETSLNQVSGQDDQLLSCSHKNDLQSSKVEHHQSASLQEGRYLSLSLPSLFPIMIDDNKIVSIYSVGVKVLYDMEVEERHNYIAGDMVHHNTACAAMEIAMHATGIYPDWFTGTRFLTPINILCAGNTNEATRDIIQKELFGDPEDDKKLGYGTIPRHCIGKVTRKAGVPNAYDTVLIKHKSGGVSKIQLKAYEQGFKKFMGLRFEIGWADEEPPPDVWEQFKRGTFSRPKSVLLVTFTPEEGMTQVVKQILDDIRQGQSLVKATWDDAPHMTKERRDLLLEQMPEHQRDMRSKGIPFMGSGLVFPVKEEDIKVDAFPIPLHWPQIWGIDFGIDHPFAAVRVAWDRDADIVYVVDCHKTKDTAMPMHVSSIRSKGDWIPVAWPHDGLNREKSSGQPLAEMYRKEGLNMLRDKFSNPHSIAQSEGEGGNSVEFGIMFILNRMKAGQFKIFSHLGDVFTELRMYHRKNGKVVAIDDDVMSAMRYATLSIRHAQTCELNEHTERYWEPMDSIAGY